MSNPLGITLCVIVRDQAGLLERLLDEHRALYDEAVVVDTGSADDSRDRASERGARVVEFPWIDDFSAARNAGLAVAAGQWILVLDCDELVGHDDFAALRSLASGPRTVCHTLPQLNYLPGGGGRGVQPVEDRHRARALGAAGYRTAWSIRLFPNHPGLRYRGVVHESLDEAALAAGLTVARHDVPIHHQGHMLEQGEPRRRHEFYGRLLARKLEQQPGDPRARYEMAVHLAASGQGELAARLAELALRSHPTWSDRYRAELLLGEIKLTQGQPHLARQHFQKAIEDRPDWPRCWEAMVAISTEMGDPQGARRYLDQARSLFPARPEWDRFSAQVSPSPGR